MATRGEQHIGKNLEPQLVIAIDFGTTGSGYAFQARADFKSDRLKIYENLDWNHDKLHYKTSTCLLTNPDKTKVWFGDEAEEEYSQLRTDDHPENWYFFRNFKMQIYEREISSDMTLTSENGKTLTALFVFSESIKWIKRHALQYIELMNSRYLELTTKWVLTVPAIWKEGQKKLMREAAQKAGIKSQNLCIALEPEVAAVYYSAAEANPPNDPQRDFDRTIWTGPYTTNIVVDMGGGTVDITTIEVQKDGTMKQIHMAKGGPMGGQKVDEKFFRYMSEIFGPRLWTTFVQEHPSGYYDFRMSFEKAKRNVQPKLRHNRVRDEFQITFSSFIIQEFEKENDGKKINDIFKSNEITKDKVSLYLGKLVFNGEILRKMMRESLDEIIGYVTEVAEGVKQNDRRVHAVILVGGFASSTFMTTEIKSALEGTLGVVVKRPPDCQLAVLRGAVLYGHNENILVSRVVRMTYGIGAAMPCLSTSPYPKEKMFKMDGSLYANGVFIPHVTRGQEVRIDEWISGDEYYPLEKDQKEIEIRIFSSESKDTKMIDDEDCKYIGKFDVKLEDEQGGSQLNTSSTEISFMFGRTELIIRAKDTATGNEVYKSLCLKD